MPIIGHDHPRIYHQRNPAYHQNTHHCFGNYMESSGILLSIRNYPHILVLYWKYHPLPGTILGRPQSCCKIHTPHLYIDWIYHNAFWYASLLSYTSVNIRVQDRKYSNKHVTQTQEYKITSFCPLKLLVHPFLSFVIPAFKYKKNYNLKYHQDFYANSRLIRAITIMIDTQ